MHYFNISIHWVSLTIYHSYVGRRAVSGQICTFISRLYFSLWTKWFTGAQLLNGILLLTFEKCHHVNIFYLWLYMFLLIRIQLVTNALIVHCAMQNGRVRGTGKTLLPVSCMAVTSISRKSLKNKGVLPVGSLVNSATCSYRSWKQSINQHLLHSSRLIDVHAPETAHAVTVDRSFISLMQYAFSGAANCPQWELLYGTRMIIYLSVVDGYHSLAYWHCSHSMRQGLCNDRVSLCLSVPSCPQPFAAVGPAGRQPRPIAARRVRSRRAAFRSISTAARRSAANASSVVFTAT